MHMVMAVAKIYYCRFIYGQWPFGYEEAACQCESDYDSDGVCDINEIYGCMEEGAYNYSPIATENQEILIFLS